MPSNSSRSANQVRIIGGEHRRRVLHFPDAPGLRPTPDRVRETLFNWLGQELTGMNCLDAFAGSGALGFEAASRHAARVLMLESSRQAVDALKRNRELIKAADVEIRQQETLGWMRGAEEQFDVIFLDPPFASGLMDQALPLAIRLLKPEGWLYVEQAGRIQPPEGFIIHREGRAGQSRFALLRRA
jgi:16S rRNA (guanine966-N2)-methyltransferase